MHLIKVALTIVGFTLGAQAFAAEEVSGEESAIFLFSETDQPADADEAKIFPAEGPDSARMWIRCESHNYRMKRCWVNGEVRSVRLVQRTSWAPCIAGRTFGATPRFVWVTRGCGGNFLVKFRRHGGGGWSDEGQN